MRKIKQMYICPAVNCVNMDVLGMLCGSTEITFLEIQTLVMAHRLNMMEVAKITTSKEQRV